MEILQGVWKQHLRSRAVVGYSIKNFLPSPLNYANSTPGCGLSLNLCALTFILDLAVVLCLEIIPKRHLKHTFGPI